jgi:tetratricopeptide (TPR) repeat protein
MQPEHSPNRFQDTFFEKANRIQAFLWYRYILTDLPGAQNHAAEWVNLFNIYPSMMTHDPDLYLRSLYYLLVFHFLLDEAEAFDRAFLALDRFIEAHRTQFNKNSEQVAFVYRELSLLNYCFLHQDYRRGLEESRRIKGALPRHAELVDSHRIMLLDYKFAAIRFALGRYQSARAYLSNLLHYRKQILRHDIDINARLLELMCLYETRELEFMGSRLTSLARSLGKDQTATPLQKHTLSMLRELHRAPPQETHAILVAYTPAYQQQDLHPADRIFLKYLDITAWIRQKTG